MIYCISLLKVVKIAIGKKGNEIKASTWNTKWQTVVTYNLHLFSLQSGWTGFLYAQTKPGSALALEYLCVLDENILSDFNAKRLL